MACVSKPGFQRRDGVNLPNLTGYDGEIARSVSTRATWMLPERLRRSGTCTRVCISIKHVMRRRSACWHDVAVTILLLDAFLLPLIPILTLNRLVYSNPAPTAVQSGHASNVSLPTVEWLAPQSNVIGTCTRREQCC